MLVNLVKRQGTNFDNSIVDLGCIEVTEGSNMLFTQFIILK